MAKNQEFPKFKDMMKDPVVRTVVTSFATIVVTLAIITFLAWHYRAKIFNLLATNYMSQVKSGESSLNFSSSTPQDNSSQAPDEVQQDSVVNAVKKAKPAVVSIIISKEVPTYDVSYDQQQSDLNNPFANMFPGFFQTPTYKQNGTKKEEIGSGSGFLISSEGLIVTNKHVVEDTSATYDVQLNDGRKFSAKVLARDGVLDIALVKISATNLPYLSLGDSSNLDVGQSVIAIGNALGEFKNTVSVGVVSGLSRSITAGDSYGQSEQLDKVIQTDAAINPGNSGGPLLNLHGDVIGVNVAVVQGASNVGFALPINSVKSAIDSVQKTGKIIRPYVGIRYIPITADLKTKNNLSVDYGILVQRGQTDSELAVIPASPADKAGIVENDIILEVDGTQINQDQNFSYLIRNKKVGDSVNLKILSKGVEKTVTLKLEAAPDNL